MATIVGVVRTGLSAILKAIGQQIIDYGTAQSSYILDTSAILFNVRQNWQSTAHFVGDHDVLLRIGGFTVDRGMAASTGRFATIITRTVTTICRSRSQLDEPNRDKLWLTEPTIGHLVFEEFVADSLQMFWPVDKDGNQITVEPMRLIRADSVWKEQTDGAWGHTALDWEIKYHLALNQNTGQVNLQ